MIETLTLIFGGFALFWVGYFIGRHMGMNNTQRDDNLVRRIVKGVVKEIQK